MSRTFYLGLREVRIQRGRRHHERGGTHPGDGERGHAAGEQRLQPRAHAEGHEGPALGPIGFRFAPGGVFLHRLRGAQPS